MKDKKNAVLEFPEQNCPKQPWVLATLSDDEALGPDGDLPTGLTVHLRQCDSCRTVADSLQGVTSELGRLAALRVPETLHGKGNARVEQALREGARLTGRFVTRDLEETALARGRFPFHGLRWPLATAAMVMIGVGVASWFSMDRGQSASTAIASDEPVWPFGDDVFGDDVSGNDGARREARASADGRSPESTLNSPDSRFEDANAHEVATGKGATALAARRASRRTRPTVVRYSSHIEAAMTDTPGTVQAAVVMPRRRDPSHRAKWRDLFDRPGGFLFTSPPRNEE